jgi:hypothetical protein
VERSLFDVERLTSALGPHASCASSRGAKRRGDPAPPPQPLDALDRFACARDDCLRVSVIARSEATRRSSAAAATRSALDRFAGARDDGFPALTHPARHREERSDAAIQNHRRNPVTPWIASLALAMTAPPGFHSLPLEPVADRLRLEQLLLTKRRPRLLLAGALRFISRFDLSHGGVRFRAVVCAVGD